MSYSTLISTAELTPHLSDLDWAILDCRFSLTDPEHGRDAYFKSHIPGAVYVHLEHDLSGPIVAGRTGRHPLPTVESFTETLSSWGIDDSVQVIAYDDSGGSIAARLWWMLRWLGHRNAAVLDGGWPKWEREGRPDHSGPESRPSRPFTPRLRRELVADAEDVEQMRADPSSRLCDARSADRYSGANETIDAVAGRIPGAVSLPYADNVDVNGSFLPVQDLKARFASQLGDIPVEKIVCYCGSGVTAAHDILAMAHAGLGDARLYPGSWSEWITDPARPVARG